MNRLYSTIPDVVESLEMAVEEYDEGKLAVIDGEQAKVVAGTGEELDERNISRNPPVCNIVFEQSEIGGFVHLTLSFHQNEVTDGAFRLTPRGANVINADQATDPRELGERLRRALDPLVEEYDAIFTFKEVSAASMASGGHFTDFEFEYAIDGVGF